MRHGRILGVSLGIEGGEEDFEIGGWIESILVNQLARGEFKSICNWRSSRLVILSLAYKRVRSERVKPRRARVEALK